MAHPDSVDEESRPEPTSLPAVEHLTVNSNHDSISRENERTVEGAEESKKTWFSYLRTRNFYVVLALGFVEFLDFDYLKERGLIILETSRQVLALSLTATNTFSSLLVGQGTSIPAFQTLFNYILLNIIYTSFTLYRYGLKKWGRLIWTDGWKCCSPRSTTTSDVYLSLTTL